MLERVIEVVDVLPDRFPTADVADPTRTGGDHAAVAADRTQVQGVQDQVTSLQAQVTGLQNQLAAQPGSVTNGQVAGLYGQEQQIATTVDQLEAALAALAAHPEVVLLFTDLSLPGADGRTLADEARRRRPGLGVLFTTGHARGGSVWNARLDPAADLLAKPFTLEALAVKVRTVLDGPAPDRPA